MMKQSSVQPRFFEQFLLWFFVATLAVILHQGDWLWRWDRVFYDNQLRFWSRPAPEDIVIVAIDEQSLRELGGWPWDRLVHARLIEILHQAGAKTIGFDVIFSEPSTMQADLALATAIKQHQRTILPVVIEQIRRGGQFIETLPISTFANAAAALGHAHVDIDRDGIVRSVFLKEGLGSAYWNHLSIEILKQSGTELDLYVTGQHSPFTQPGSPLKWRRNFEILIPYSGPPNHFKRISYSQVLNENFAANAFKDKLVLVGATASGLGDVLPTPMSANNEPMPGVEIHANIIDALRSGWTIQPLAKHWALLLTAILVLLPAFIFTYFSPRLNLIVTLLLISATVAIDFLLLHLLHIWFPPAATLLCLAISYPLWSWRRLEHALRYLNLELNQLHEEQSKLPTTHTPTLEGALQFLQQLLPIKGWIIYNEHKTIRNQKGIPPHPLPTYISKEEWIQSGHDQWINLDSNEISYVGLSWKANAQLSKHQQAVLEQLANLYRKPLDQTPASAELIYSRILQVQSATSRMRALSRFVADTVSQMADGTLVVDSTGTIVLTNPTAEAYLCKSDKPNYKIFSLQECLSNLELPNHRSWTDLLGNTLIDHHAQQIEARTQTGKDLLVQIAPLSSDTGLLGGFIVNLSDISQLKESERRRDELLSFLSHDLRSPLVSLLALLEVAKSTNADTKNLSLLSDMENYTHRTLSLADQFLHLSHAESNEEIQFECQDIRTLIDSAVATVYAQANKKHIQITTKVATEFTWVDGDGTLLERAFINIISNAVKYSPENTSILILVNEQQNHLQCIIRDQGIGIDADDIATLFDRFKRAKNVKRSNETGSGLGLALVKAVLDKHNGTITVASKPGQGTEFTIILPKSTIEIPAADL